jgi:hypothetical protein
MKRQTLHTIAKVLLIISLAMHWVYKTLPTLLSFIQKKVNRGCVKSIHSHLGRRMFHANPAMATNERLNQMESVKYYNLPMLLPYTK